MTVTPIMPRHLYLVTYNGQSILIAARDAGEAIRKAFCLPEVA